MSVSKVDLTFLKGRTPPHELDSSDREQRPVAVAWTISKRGGFESAASTSGINRPELQVGRPRKVEELRLR
jgi:hypothetical protein